MNICFFSENINFILSCQKEVVEWLGYIIQQENYILIHLNFIFCSDTYLYPINKTYLQHDTLTDVITFDYSGAPYTILGDIYISIDRVRENAHALHHTFYEELYTVMVHGVLHLLGYQDHTQNLKSIMHEKENYYVAHFMKNRLGYIH